MICTLIFSTNRVILSEKGGVAMTTNRIAAFRRENGMNQKELGAALGVAQTTVSAWETGRNEPDSVSLSRMAKLFHTTIGYLMGLEPESYRHGLSKEQYEDLQYRQEIQQAMSEETETDQDPLDSKTIRELIWQENMERWDRSGKPDTIEGFLVSEMIDSFPVELRKAALEVMYSFKRAADYKSE